jgi:hypothetical protein
MFIDESLESPSFPLLSPLFHILVCSMQGPESDLTDSPAIDKLWKHWKGETLNAPNASVNGGGL